MRPQGPDARRYLAAGAGEPVTRPFHLRPLLPAACGTNLRLWWTVWVTSWIVLGLSTFAWASNRGLDPIHAGLCALLLCGLPGILGPAVSIPVQVDLPATALTMLGATIAITGKPWAIVVGLLIIGIATGIRETSPILGALVLWSPLPLLLLAIPLTIHLVRTPATSSGVPEWDLILEHPIRTALAYHQNRWRDARLMVLPWGVCLIGLYDADWRLALILAIAYAQLLVATDSVRLYQHLAGPSLAYAAAILIPTPWVPLAIVGHLFWISKPERI